MANATALVEPGIANTSVSPANPPTARLNIAAGHPLTSRLTVDVRAYTFIPRLNSEFSGDHGPAYQCPFCECEVPRLKAIKPGVRLTHPYVPQPFDTGGRIVDKDGVICLGLYKVSGDHDARWRKMVRTFNG